MSGNSTITLTPEQMDLSKDLTHLNKMTVIHLVGGMSQRAAYKSAGGKAATDSSADSAVSKMLSRDKVKAFYDSLVATSAKSSIMSREEAMEILTNQARTNVSDIADFRRAQVGEKDGEPVYQTVWDLKNSDDITPEQMASIMEVSAGKDGLKFKMHDQKAAIKQLTEMEGWNAAQRVEHTGKDGEAIKTEDVGDNAVARRVAFLLAKGSKT